MRLPQNVPVTEMMFHTFSIVAVFKNAGIILVLVLQLQCRYYPALLYLSLTDSLRQKLIKKIVLLLASTTIKWEKSSHLKTLMGTRIAR